MLVSESGLEISVKPGESALEVLLRNAFGQQRARARKGDGELQAAVSRIDDHFVVSRLHDNQRRDVLVGDDGIGRFGNAAAGLGASLTRVDA